MHLLGYCDERTTTKFFRISVCCRLLSTTSSSLRSHATTSLRSSLVSNAKSSLGMCGYSNAAT